MEHFGSTGQLVTLGLVDNSIGAVAKGLALVDVEASIAKELTSSSLLISHSYFHSYVNSFNYSLLHTNPPLIQS